MSEQESRRVWKSRNDLAEAILATQSVGGADAIREQYAATVRQYPLYTYWFTRVLDLVAASEQPLDVLEYGPGPGTLARLLTLAPNVQSYLGVEPNPTFREMTAQEIGSSGTVIDSTVETYVAKGSADLVVATAAYHHFSDKPVAIRNMHENLRANGRLVIADVFIPSYDFNSDFDPIDPRDFVSKMARYAAAQILAMPSPTSADVEDQVKTFTLDILRLGELKVCTGILEHQMRAAGFGDISIERMSEPGRSRDYEALGYHFITARK